MKKENDIRELKDTTALSQWVEIIGQDPHIWR